MMQVLFTGRLLRNLSAGVALAALPLTASVLLGMLALSPKPATVAGAEVLRKVSIRQVFKANSALHSN